MAHEAGCMTIMEGIAKGLGALIRWVKNTGDMLDKEITVSTPFLNGKVLDVDVTGPSSRFVLIDHGNGGLVVNIQRGWVGR